MKPYKHKSGITQENNAWLSCDPEDLWVFDKLILSKKLGYICGPRGVDVPCEGIYITRPCVNITGMGIGASFTYLAKDTDSILPPGYFWSEIFQGRHLSIDYINGEQILAVQGFRNARNPLWKWSRWKRVKDIVPLPEIVKPLVKKYPYMNIETIGGKVIEIHLRLNPDWISEDIVEIIPVFKGDNIIVSSEYEYIENKDFLREGFYIRRSNNGIPR
jgi:hypothetical protein